VSPSIVTAITPVLASTAPSNAKMPFTRRIWDQFDNEQPSFIQKVSDDKISIERASMGLSPGFQCPRGSNGKHDRDKSLERGVTWLNVSGSSSTRGKRLSYSQSSG
jgi:hypothetical protein